MTVTAELILDNVNKVTNASYSLYWTQKDLVSFLQNCRDLRFGMSEYFFIYFQELLTEL